MIFGLSIVIVFFNLVVFTQLTKFMSISAIEIFLYLGISSVLCSYLIYKAIPKFIGRKILTDRTQDGIYTNLDKFIYKMSDGYEVKKYTKETIVSLFFGMNFLTLFFVFNELFSIDEYESLECQIINSDIQITRNKGAADYVSTISEDLFYKLSCNNGKIFRLQDRNLLIKNWNQELCKDTLINKKQSNELTLLDKKYLLDNSDYLELIIKNGWFTYYSMEEIIIYHPINY